MDKGTKIGTIMVSYELKSDEYTNFLRLLAEYGEQFMIINEITSS